MEKWIFLLLGLINNIKDNAVTRINTVALSSLSDGRTKFSKGIAVVSI